MIELLVTMAVAGVLFSLAVVSAQAVKRKSKDLVCKINQRNYRVNREILFTDFAQQASRRGLSNEETAEFNICFVEECTAPLFPDPTLGKMRISYSKPLTCPYAFGDGTTRASLYTLASFEGVYEAKKHLIDGNHILLTYGENMSFLYSDHSSSDVEAVWDNVNTDRVIRMQARSWLLGLESEKVFEFNNRVLHPHLGRGQLQTYRSGKQSWKKKG